MAKLAPRFKVLESLTKFDIDMQITQHILMREVNAAGKMDTGRNQEKELLTTMTRLRLECLVRL